VWPQIYVCDGNSTNDVEYDWQVTSVHHILTCGRLHAPATRFRPCMNQAVPPSSWSHCHCHITISHHNLTLTLTKQFHHRRPGCTVTSQSTQQTRHAQLMPNYVCSHWISRHGNTWHVLINQQVFCESTAQRNDTIWKSFWT